MALMFRSTGPRLGWNFRLLWAGSAISMVGTVNTTVAVPFAALMLTGSAFYAGLAGFIGALPRLLMQIPAGFLADRVDRRRMLVVSQTTRIAAAMMLWLGLYLWGQDCPMAF